MSNKLPKYILVGIYIFAVVLGFYINLLYSGDKNSLGVYTQIPLTLIPTIGAFVGLHNARKWGNFASLTGKSLIFLSMGILSWGWGMFVWNTYIFVLGFKVVPYPSFADMIFLFAQPFWIVGALYLSRVIGAQFGARSAFGRALMYAVPVIAMVMSYFLLFVVARGGYITIDPDKLKVFFDFYYPIGTSVSLSVVAVIFLLSHKFLGGYYRTAVYMLFGGFVCQYIGDFWYTYANNYLLYFNGHWSDLFFTSSMFLLSVGVMSMSPDTI